MSPAIRAVILGGGGHARVLLDALLQRPGIEVVGIVDADARRWNTEMMGIRILGGDDLLPGLPGSGVTHFVVGCAGACVNELRPRLFAQARTCGLSPLTVIHPSAVVSAFAVVGEGAQIMPGAVVNAGALLEKGAIVNSGAIVEHDCVIGAHAHVATGARLAGGVQVGADAFVGMGAAVRQGIRIGRRATVAAGAVVVRDVEPGAVVAGVPATPMTGRRGADHG